MSSVASSIVTSKPIDDAIIQSYWRSWLHTKYSLSEIGSERRNGYGWYKNEPKEVLKKYPEIKHIPPRWKNESEHERKMVSTLDDTELLVNLCFHCDTAINFGSTMAFDFAQFDKKVVYLNYNHPKIDDTVWTSELFYGYTHFESLKNLEAVYWASSENEIKPCIQKALIENNKSVHLSLKDWKSIVAPYSDSAIENLHRVFETNGKS